MKGGGIRLRGLPDEKDNKDLLIYIFATSAHVDLVKIMTICLT
jgi:hypothetical protein